MKCWSLAAAVCCYQGCNAFKLPLSDGAVAVKLSAIPEDHSLRPLWNELSGISSASAVPRTSLYTEVDAVHMQRALMEAQQAFDRGEVISQTLLTVPAESIIKVPIGAVVVDNTGTVLGSAGNAVEALHDATAHAEVQAMRAAATAYGDWRLTEPQLHLEWTDCAYLHCMLSARHRIARVVYGAVDERLGALGSWIDLSEQLQTHPFHALQSVTGGVLAPQSSALMRQFFKQGNALAHCTACLHFIACCRCAAVLADTPEANFLACFAALRGACEIKRQRSLLLMMFKSSKQEDDSTG
eukprot:11042-Heterococcus_DN1.PRE.1